MSEMPKTVMAEMPRARVRFLGRGNQPLPHPLGDLKECQKLPSRVQADPRLLKGYLIS